MTKMRILIGIVFVIFIAKGIDCLGSVCENYCDNCCDCFKNKDENITPESLVNDNWFKAKGKNLVLMIFKKENDNDIFTSTENGDKVSFKLDEKDNSKIAYQDETKNKLKLNDQKYALFEIKTKGEYTVYLYCSDVESSMKNYGIFQSKDHKSISAIACDIEEVTNMACMFSECKNLEELKFGDNFNTTKVTNMKSMFNNCRSLKNLDLQKFDTKNVETMESMFNYCSSLKELDLQKFNTTNVKNMENMFCQCKYLAELKIEENFNTSSVENMGFMFYECSKLTKLDLKNFNTENVTDMGFMFTGCSSLENLEFEKNFNTTRVTDMTCMFSNCSSLINLDLKNFNTENVTNMYSMFSDCSSLKNLNLDSFNFENVTDMRNMFSGCSSFPEDIRNKLDNVEEIIKFFKEKNN